MSNTVERTIHCNSYVMKIIYYAICINTYLKCNGYTSLQKNIVDLIESDYVIRNSKSSNVSSGKMINLIIEKLKTTEWQVDFDCKYITPTTIRDSGLFNYALKLENLKMGELTYIEFLHVLRFMVKQRQYLINIGLNTIYLNNLIKTDNRMNTHIFIFYFICLKKWGGKK